MEIKKTTGLKSIVLGGKTKELITDPLRGLNNILIRPIRHWSIFDMMFPDGPSASTLIFNPPPSFCRVPKPCTFHFVGHIFLPSCHVVWPDCATTLFLLRKLTMPTVDTDYWKPLWQIYYYIHLGNNLLS